MSNGYGFCIPAILAAAILTGCAVSHLSSPTLSAGQHPKVFDATIQQHVRYNYLVSLPKGYGETPGKKWPLIIFLHGIGERGTDVNMLKKHGIPKIVDQETDFPFVALSPQCPETSFWTNEVPGLNALLDKAMNDYSIDPDRVYLTGLSMGGYGTWSWAIEHPERFAAIAPVCGAGESLRAGRIKDIPCWVFHGAKDTTVPPAKSIEMVNALKANGANPKFTLYPDAAHDSWTVTYNNPELYKWFLEQKRPTKKP